MKLTIHGIEYWLAFRFHNGLWCAMARVGDRHCGMTAHTKADAETALALLIERGEHVFQWADEGLRQQQLSEAA